MASGNLAKWLFKEGDLVEAGAVIAEVETDKAVVDYETTDDGYLAKILVSEGTSDVAVGIPLAIMVENEEDIAAFASYSADSAAAAPAPSAPPPAAAAPPPPPPPSPAAPAPVAAAVQSVAGGRVVASPLARKLAREGGLDIGQLGAGSGPGGRLIRMDVEHALASPQPAAMAEPAAAVAAAPAAPQPAVSEPALALPGGDYTDMTAGNIRKVIARNTTLSKTTIPHYYLTMDVNIDELMATRAGLNAGLGDAKLSVNDFVIKAAALACKTVPACNSAWMGDAIREYHYVDINVGMSVDAGLISPVVKGADTSGLGAISSRVKSLAAGARDNTLSVEDHATGTFTISNLGMFGISNFSAIISPPQACILAVGAAQDRLLPNDDPEAESPYKVAKLMSVTLSCDHRVVDGAVGAQWLQAFKTLMESPVKMLL